MSRPRRRAHGLHAAALTRFATLTALLALAGCGELDPAIGPDRVGPPPFEPLPAADAGPDSDADAAPPCDIVDSDPAVPVTFADVRGRVFGQFCSCHTTPGGSGQILGGLDLRDRDKILAGGRQGGAQDVVPGDPCRSFMVGKISGMPAFGEPMPRGLAPLSAPDRQLIIDWIAEGAPP